MCGGLALHFVGACRTRREKNSPPFPLSCRRFFKKICTFLYDLVAEYRGSTLGNVPAAFRVG